MGSLYPLAMTICITLCNITSDVSSVEKNVLSHSRRGRGLTILKNSVVVSYTIKYIVII